MVSLIKDRIVCGTPDNSLRERHLREQGLYLEKALMLCSAAETVKSQAKELVSESCAVDAVKECKHAKACKALRKLTGGKTRDRNYVIAVDYSILLNNAQLTRKYAITVVRITMLQVIAGKWQKRRQVNSVLENEPEEYHIDVLSDNEQNKRDWTVPLQASQKIFRLILTLEVKYSLFQLKAFILRPNMCETNIKVTGYSGADIPVKGTCVTKVTSKKQGRFAVICSDAKGCAIDTGVPVSD